MDWHLVISVQQQTPDNDFCHFSISNVRFAFWAFFRKPEKLGSHTGSKWWPGDPVTGTWKMTQMIHWPSDPMTQFHVWCPGSFRWSMVRWRWRCLAVGRRESIWRCWRHATRWSCRPAVSAGGRRGSSTGRPSTMTAGRALDPASRESSTAAATFRRVGFRCADSRVEIPELQHPPTYAAY